MQRKSKVTMFQTVLLLLIMTYSASMRIVPKFAVDSAKQAAWLCPAIGTVGIGIMLFVLYSFLKKYPGKSIPDIIYKICGKVLGKIIVLIYIIWLLILLSLYVRYFGERLVSSIYSGSDMRIFFVILLVLVAVILRKDIIVLARMNNLIFSLLAFQYFFLMSLLLIKVDLRFITPISSIDIVPAIKGSMGYIGIEVYIFYFFMISDKIDTKNFKKNAIGRTIFTVSALTLLTICLLGTFGHQTMQKLPFPLLMAVKNISKVGNFSGLDSLFISFWVMADFITVCLFSYIILNLMKSLFNLYDYTHLLSILMIFTFVLSQFLSVNVFELQSFSSKVGIQTNVATGLLFPVLLYIIGKIRRKL